MDPERVKMKLLILIVPSDRHAGKIVGIDLDQIKRIWGPGTDSPGCAGSSDSDHHRALGLRVADRGKADVGIVNVSTHHQVYTVTIENLNRLITGLE